MTNRIYDTHYYYVQEINKLNLPALILYDKLLVQVSLLTYFAHNLQVNHTLMNSDA